MVFLATSFPSAWGAAVVSGELTAPTKYSHSRRRELAVYQLLRVSDCPTHRVLYDEWDCLVARPGIPTAYLVGIRSNTREHFRTTLCPALRESP